MTRFLTCLLAIMISPEMEADGHDKVIPVSDNIVLIIKIGLVLAAIGVVFLLASLLRAVIRKRNLPEPVSYVLIVLGTLLVTGIWQWLAFYVDPPDTIGLLFALTSILILIFAPILLYRISPKRTPDIHKHSSRERKVQ